MRTKMDKALCEAYFNMLSEKKTVKTLTESKKQINERQIARGDANYKSIMESYQSVICENKGLDKYRKFLQDTYGVSTFMQLPDNKKAECKSKWEKIKTEAKAKKDEDDMIKENSILERAAQIKANDSKLSWVEARKKAEDELKDSEVEENKAEKKDDEDDTIEESADKGVINPPKDLKADVEKIKKVKSEKKDDEEEIEEAKKAKKDDEDDEDDEEIEESADKGVINPPKDLKADVEKIKKVKSEKKDDEDEEEECNEEKKSFKDLAEKFLRENSDEKKKS